MCKTNSNVIKILSTVLMGAVTGTFNLLAQPVFNKALSPVTVTDVRGQQSQNGSRNFIPDSLARLQFSGTSINDLLSFTTPVFIKNYGPGSISTISFRGTSASHTAIVWNGFNLQNTMLGQPDLSLIPMAAINDIQVQAGGNSVMYGSGAIGGSIYLKSKLVYMDDSVHYVAQSQFGQFGNKQYSLQLALPVFHNSRLAFKAYSNSALNNYTFKNTAIVGSPQQKQEHAAYTQQGFLVDYEQRLTTNQKLQFHYWVHQNNRDLPATMLQYASIANQKDVSHKATLEWDKTGERSKLQFRTGYFYDELRYADALSALVSSNYTHNLTSEVEQSFQITPKKYLRSGITNNLLWANTRNYATPIFQWRNALFAGYQYASLNHKLMFNLNSRAERIDRLIAPLVFGIGAEWNLKSDITCKLRGSKNFRYPTFNDLYWNPGGNVNLKSENSLNAEGGLLFRKKIISVLLTFEATVFTNSVSNWIAWLPDSVNPTIWSPQNIARVWSRGAEYSLQTEWKATSITTFGISGLYSWVVATNEKTNGSREGLHRQLVYVPRQNASFRLFVKIKNITCSYAHQYTGLRFITVDNYDYLNPYQVASLHFGVTTTVNHFPLSFFINIKNLWNQSYQVMAWRPMPGRYVEAGLKIQFIHSIHKNKTS
jgi:iron complex outermembrane receptor protein